MKTIDNFMANKAKLGKLKLEARKERREFDVLKQISDSILFLLNKTFDPKKYQEELFESDVSYYETFLLPFTSNNINLTDLKIELYNDHVGKIYHPNVKNIFIPIISVEWENLDQEKDLPEISKLYKEYYELTSIKDLKKVFEVATEIQKELTYENADVFDSQIDIKDLFNKQNSIKNILKKMMNTEANRLKLAKVLALNCTIDNLLDVFSILRDNNSLSFDSILDIFIKFLNQVKNARELNRKSKKELFEQILKDNKVIKNDSNE